MEPACLLWSSERKLSVWAGVGQTSELMQSYNNVAQLGHFRGANISTNHQTIAGVVNSTVSGGKLNRNRPPLLPSGPVDLDIQIANFFAERVAVQT